MQKITTILGAFVAALALTATATAQEKAASFDFKDPKGVNSILFGLDSPLEPIVGFAKDIAGTVSHGDTTTGTITFPTASITTPNERMNGVLHGEDWLNAAANPSVTFAFTHSDGTFNGKLTLAGVTKDITAPGTVTLVEGGAAARGAGEGDLLVLRSKFTINRSEFGIKPGVVLDKVAEKIDLNVMIAGYPQK